MEMADGGLAKSPDSIEKKERLVFDPEEYTLRKRLPRTCPKARNDIYVSRKTNFKAQLERCQKLLDSEDTEIFIHGLGAAINRAINLALKLKAIHLNGLEIAVNTSTVELIDDLEPELDELEPITQARNNSAIHIKVFKPIAS